MESLVSQPDIPRCIAAYLLGTVFLGMFGYINYYFYKIFFIDWIYLPAVYHTSFYLYSSSIEGASIFVFYQLYLKINEFCPSALTLSIQ